MSRDNRFMYIVHVCMSVVVNVWGNVCCVAAQWACRCSFHKFCLSFCMSEVISSFRSWRTGSQVFAPLMFFV